MGCEDPVARQALLDTAIDFCETTGVAQVVTDPLAAVANQPNYTPVLPAGQTVVAVRRAWYGAAALDPVADDEIASVLAYHATALNDTAPRGTPREYYWHESEVWVHPVPEASVGLAFTFRIAVKPTTDATTIPDELLVNWREAVVDGALSRVLGMRGTIHYDPAESDRAAGRYALAKNRARIAARGGRASGELSVRMRPFA